MVRVYIDVSGLLYGSFLPVGRFNVKSKKLATLRFHLHFMQFDIEEFYPSIFKDLLLKAIDYEKSFAYISNHETKTITHSRKSPLFSNTDE